MGLARRLKLVGIDPPAYAADAPVKVAFATSDMKRVDQHFGVAESFAVYALGPEGARFTQAVQFGRSEADGREDKLAVRLEALSGCVALYCLAVGASAIEQLRAKGIRPVKVPGGTRIKDLVATLQDELRHPGAWPAGALARHGPRAAARFEDMEREGWIE